MPRRIIYTKFSCCVRIIFKETTPSPGKLGTHYSTYPRILNAKKPEAMATSRANEQEALSTYPQSQDAMASAPSAKPLVTIPIQRGSYTTFVSVSPTIILLALHHERFSAITAEAMFEHGGLHQGLVVEDMVVCWAGGDIHLPIYTSRRFPVMTELHEKDLAATLRYLDKGRGYGTVEGKLI